MTTDRKQRLGQRNGVNLATTNGPVELVIRVSHKEHMFADDGIHITKNKVSLWQNPNRKARKLEIKN